MSMNLNYENPERITIFSYLHMNCLQLFEYYHHNNKKIKFLVELLIKVDLALSKQTLVGAFTAR